MPLTLQDICLPLKPVPDSTTCSAALSLFLSDPAAFALPVRIEAAAAEAALSLVTRARLSEAMLGPNGRDIYAARPVRYLLTPEPFIAEGRLPVARVASEAAERGGDALTDGVIVTGPAGYLGYVSPAAILKAIAEENALRARSQRAGHRQIEALRMANQSLTEGRARLLAFVGHEIRTPLSGILGVADLLKDQAGSAETRRLAATIASSGEHLERLLSDLIDLSCLQVGELPLRVEPFDLRRLAAEIRDLWQPAFDAKKISLRMMVARMSDLRIEGDPGRLRQILFNLISNALKFTDQGQVTVQISTGKTADGLLLRMSVADTGRGIPDRDKARLFEEFQQAEETVASGQGGSGLGLSIARGLARRLGGDISLADNPGGGCVFTVLVPVCRAGPRLAVTEEKKSVSGKFELGSILVAEDHQTTAFVIREALVAAGWRVDLVADAAQAREYLRQRTYQAVVTDMHMPGGGGSAVLASVRSGPGPNRPIPVLALTGDTSEEQARAGRRAGFSAIIAKPVRPRLLVAALADALLEGAAAPRKAG